MSRSGRLIFSYDKGLRQSTSIHITSRETHSTLPA